MTKTYLSICIPTKGRLEILRDTLDSIFLDCEIDYNEFEVVISDNSTDNLLSDMLKDYHCYPNIIYTQTSVEGFLNSFNVLKMANGMFLKLHNDYTRFNAGALTEMLSFVKSEMKLKPMTFFSNSEFGSNKINRYSSFDEFIYDLSYLSTWSTGFSIWKEDFDMCSSIEVDKMFPHTSLLLYQYNKNLYVINDRKLFYNQDVLTKGGYNLFENFAVLYLNMMNNSLKMGQVSIRTFDHIKSDLFKNFLVTWYYNTKIAKNQFTFKLDGIKSSVKVYYSGAQYYKMIIAAYKKAFLKSIKKIISRY